MSSPVPLRQHRLTQLDLIRGVAVLGILVMNTLFFAFQSDGYFNVSYPAGQSSLDWLFGIFGEIFVDQKFMGLFSILFGASFLLFYERASAKGAHPTKLTLWRNALLLLIGLGHVSIWDGDILVVYALCAPLLLFFRTLSGERLIALGAALFLSSALFNELLAGCDQRSLQALLTTSSGEEAAGSAELFFSADVFARALGMMLYGMGLYRSGYLREPERALKQRRAAIGALIAGVCLSAAGLLWTAYHNFELSQVMRGNLMNTVATLPMSFAYLTLLSCWDQRGDSLLRRRLRSLGQMALSNYIAQTLICTLLIALTPSLLHTRSTLWIAIVVIWTAQLYGSSFWLRRHRFGPLEWLWRSATYRRVEALRRLS